MRLTQRRIVTAALVLVLALGAWWLATPTPPDAGVPLGEDGNLGASPPRHADQTNPEPASAPTRAPHPPRDAPLAQVWSTLLPAAQAGDAGAACRLAVETLRCLGSLRLADAMESRAGPRAGELQALRAFEASPSSFAREEQTGDKVSHDSLPDSQQRIHALNARCEGLSQERAEQAVALLRAAALAGEPDAQSVYAAGEGWFLTLPGGMANPTFDEWRREAPLVVARMLDAGHPDAPGLLAGAYSNQTWLSGLYEHDLERASAFLILNTRLMGKPELADQQLRDIPPEVRARARQQADALFARHYAGRQTAKAGFWLGAGIRIAQADFGGYGNRPVPCKPAPAAP